MRDIVQYIGEGFFKNMHADVDSMIEDLFSRIQSQPDKYRIYIHSYVVTRSTWSYTSSFDKESGILTIQQRDIKLEIDIKKDWDVCWGKIYKDIIDFNANALVFGIYAQDQTPSGRKKIGNITVGADKWDSRRYTYKMINNKLEFVK